MIRIRFLLLIGVTLIFVCGACEQEKKTDKDTYREILTSRTLGLAYLEENKLNEAEAEFLKLIELAPEEAMGYANLGLVYLRQGKHQESIDQLKKAVDIDPQNPDIRLILAKVYEVSGKNEQSLEELHNIIEIAPDHVKTLYSLAEFYGKKDDPGSLAQREKYLSDIVELAPQNIVPQLYLVEVLIRNEKPDPALARLELIEQQFPAFPEEADAFFDKAIAGLHEGKISDALTAVRIFHNFLKVSSGYQAGIQELKGPGGELIGFPVITMGEAVPAYVQEGESILEAMKFTDVSETVGLAIPKQNAGSNQEEEDNTLRIALSDYDGDGDQDLCIVSTHDRGVSLFTNNMGSYTNIASELDLVNEGRVTDVQFADYDNDGYLDLFILNEKSSILYHNEGDGKLKRVENVFPEKVNGNVAKFIDLDHDGDLDLFIGRNGKNKVFRNNADGTFTEVGEQMNLAGKEENTLDAAMGDFDDDGDIDLYVVNREAPDNLFTNLRESRFQDIMDKTGISSITYTRKVEAGDYNNDGYLDLFILGDENEYHGLYSNNRDGTFEEDEETENIRQFVGGLEGSDVRFMDFDNDGALDIVIAGSPQQPGKRSLVLIHNDGWSAFEETPHLLPDNLPDIDQLEFADFNEDGDLDLYLPARDGGVRLLRNDGGNANHYLKIQLVGLRTGSSKNNHFGIGSKVEVRSGDLYQMKVVNSPNVHFGLGNRSQADVVRIVWTNGVPQNMFTPRSNQDLIEEQELKGSCPFLYTWDGEKFVFFKDMMWRSALGMPKGIMGGSTQYAFADASREYLKIPGHMLKEKDGKYILQVTSELWETIYMDEIKIVAVDHPAPVEIEVDERFTPPPFPPMNICNVRNILKPVKAIDEAGNDVLSQIKEKDDIYISNLKPEKYQGVTQMKELILDPGKEVKTENLHLFLKGWIFPTDASINVAIAQSEDIMVIPPMLQVLNEACEWVTVDENIGFPMGKDKTMVIDLENKFLSEYRLVRILTNMEIYWDQIYFGQNDEDSPVQITELKPISADLHYRGFSRMYRKGGRYGPHWFDYDEVTEGQQWRDLTGAYTRYGEVNKLLLEADNQYIITNAGDEITVKFDAGALPSLPEGWERDFLIYSVGWVKDGDLNTAHGQTVKPLPFHGMSSYPFQRDESYPDDEALKKYHQEYNTRTVTAEEFQNALSGGN